MIIHSNNYIIFIGITLVVMNTVGQILLKRASLENRIFLLALGYILFLGTVIVSYFLLKVIDLKYFTIIMSLNYITVLFSSAYFFKESLGFYKLSGTFILLLGIYIFIGGV